MSQPIAKFDQRMRGRILHGMEKRPDTLDHLWTCASLIILRTRDEFKSNEQVYEVLDAVDSCLQQLRKRWQLGFSRH